MDRVYMNHRPNEQRIHIEIEAAEIRELLADLEPNTEAFQHGVSHRLTEILRAANRTFTP